MTNHIFKIGDLIQDTNTKECGVVIAIDDKYIQAFWFSYEPISNETWWTMSWFSLVNQ